MSERISRVWAEEVDPPATLRLSWQVSGDEPGAVPDEDVASAVMATDGVVSADFDDEGLVVVIDPEQVSRYRLAAVIREALGTAAPDVPEESTIARVWAEDLAEDRVRITWARTDQEAKPGAAEECRRVAAWLAAMHGVRSATLDDEGVVVTYRPDALGRLAAGNVVRAALAEETPLRQRADELMRRSPTYGKLAQRLAMDDRVSPLPDAAKQAVAARGRGGAGGTVARTTAMRFIPGATMISRVQTLLPVLQELSAWSRNADPAIVEEHLAAVGLTREAIKRDTATAHEIRFYARDIAAEATSELAGKAAEGARKALSTGREIFASVRESARSAASAKEPTERRPSDDDASGSH